MVKFIRVSVAWLCFALPVSTSPECHALAGTGVWLPDPLISIQAQPSVPPIVPLTPPAPQGAYPDKKPPMAGTAPVPAPAPGAKAAKAPDAAKPGLAVAVPRSAAERDKALTDLYAHLATAEDAKQAAAIALSIEKLWGTPGSDTVSLLSQRANQAVRANNPDLALKLLDAVVTLAPDYADGWSQRAATHLLKKDYERAMGDVRRTLALDPNHFRALDGLFHILYELGRKKDALKVGRQLLDVNPFHDGAKQLVDELARELEGRGI